MQKSPRLLIGTSNKIFLLDPITEQLELLLERKKRKKWFFFDASSKGFFGICQLDPCTIIAAAREKLGTKKAGKPSTDVIVHQVPLSGGGGPSCKVMDVHDVHQISCYEGDVYLTDTGKNRIVIAKLDSGCVVKRLNVGPARQDISHINAVIVNGGVLYVGLNNRGDKDAEVIKIPIARLPEGECDLLAPELGAEITVLSGCHHTHDIHLDSDRIMFCASHDGNIHYVGEEKPFYSSSDWVRGLASTEDSIWVGVSQKAERGKRHSEDLFGEVVEIDKSTGCELRRIRIEGAGQVNDLLFINE
ncbi:hypothetical protein ACMXYO_03975 [Neptuniibacter sp. QD37_6]|uniref:hypothetical protein n=1 Tax=Neptuniibacter sp. QD37_6 TaxID=3398210 RepID=UPI0039F57A48